MFNLYFYIRWLASINIYHRTATTFSVLQYTLSDKTKSDKILVTSKGFGHFCSTNNFIYFEILKYDQISILRDSDCVFSREKLKNLSQIGNQYFIFQSLCHISHQLQICNNKSVTNQIFISFNKSGFVFLLGFTTSLSLSNLGVSLIKDRMVFSSFWASQAHYRFGSLRKIHLSKVLSSFSMFVLPLHCRSGSLLEIR